MLKLARVLLALLVVSVITGSIAAAEGANDKRSGKGKRRLEEVIFDKADFLSRLPKKTFVSPMEVDPTKSPQAIGALKKSLAELGEVEDLEWVLLPKTAVHPKVTYYGKPTYPWDLREKGITGEALFLVLINAEGGVAAVHCPRYTHREFAIYGAAALARWKLTPGKFRETAVPVLFAQTIGFTLSN